MEQKGTIKKVFAIRSGVSQNGNNWMMQDFLLEFPVWGGTACMLFTVSGEERISRFDLKEGEKNVTVHFSVEARSYKNKDGVEQWRNDVRAYKLVREEQDIVTQLAVAQQARDERREHETEQKGDGLPF